MKIRTILMLMMILAVSVSAQISGSAHDFTASGSGATGTETGMCIYCHTPHTTDGADLLWNKGNTEPATYNTVTHAGTASSSGEGTTACMSCHDGSLSIGVIENASGSGGTGSTLTITPNTGNVTAGGLIDGTITDMTTSLAGDHPVGILYTESLAADASHFKAVATAEASGIKFFNSKVECASCHDPHNTTGVTTFLREANTASALCLMCHTK